MKHFEDSFTRDPLITDIGLVERVISRLVADDENSFLTSMPSQREIWETIRAMDDYSSPGPDGFRGNFYVHCWSIISDDVVSAIQCFFSNGFIMPNYNNSLLILIPKKQESVHLNDYQLIALANFSFKIMTKILADRLGSVASRIISPNHSAFIEGMSIIDPIICTSECINLLDTN